MRCGQLYSKNRENQTKHQTNQPAASPPHPPPKKKPNQASRLKTKAANTRDLQKILTKVNVAPEIFISAVSFESQTYTNVSNCQR